MEGASSTYYHQPTLFQPQPLSPLDPPIVFSTTDDDEHGMTRLSYDGMDQGFQLFNPCYSSPLQCGQPLVDTPLQQWAYNSEEKRILSPYPGPMTTFSNSTDGFSPAPPELMWAQPHPSTTTEQARTISRAGSFTSNSSCWTSCPRSDLARSDMSRSVSPNASEMARWGRRQEQGTWRCAYPGCTSKSKFRRGCDLRKHYRRHTKSLFCRYAGCKQATEGGFSSEKDRARHEAKHDPQIPCDWAGCSRVFSRVDNMVSLTHDLSLLYPC